MMRTTIVVLLDVILNVVNQPREALACAKEYLRKPNDFWDYMLFSDERKFNIFCSDCPQAVWRKPNTELDKRKFAASIKLGVAEMNVGGCMSAANV